MCRDDDSLCRLVLVTNVLLSDGDDRAAWDSRSAESSVPDESFDCCEYIDCRLL
jgi:hypothetical protein